MSAPDPLADLLAYLRIARECATMAPPAYLYRGPADYLLQHGRACVPAPLPDGVVRGIPQQCFYNAATLARRSRGRLRYVEGYALGIIPVEHAWCVDADWRVVDPTWPDPGSAYFGVEIDLAAVRRASTRRPVSRRSTSALFDWLGRFPLLQAPKP